MIDNFNIRKDNLHMNKNLKKCIAGILSIAMLASCQTAGAVFAVDSDVSVKDSSDILDIYEPETGIQC